MDVEKLVRPVTAKVVAAKVAKNKDGTDSMDENMTFVMHTIL